MHKKNVLRAGIIGNGNMGQVHSENLKVLAEEMQVEVTAVADPNEELRNQAKKDWPEVKTYTDGLAMLENEELDAVHICIPTHLHMKYSVAALERGIHVFTEKPVCLTKKEGERLLKAEKQSGKSVAVGQVVRYFKEYQYLKEIYDNRTYGELKSLRLRRSGEYPSPWFLNSAKSGGVILDLHIHDVDFIKYLLGRPGSIKVYQTEFQEGTVNQVLAEFRYGMIPVSAEALWDVSPSAPFIAEYQVCFEGGTLVYHNQKENSLILYEQNGNVTYPDAAEEVIKVTKDKIAYYKEIEAFYQMLRTGEHKKIVRLEDALETMGILWEEQRIGRG